MRLLHQMPIAPLDPQRFSAVLDDRAQQAWQDVVRRSAQEFGGRVIWNVNSTGKGGGVVELLNPLLGYARGAGVDARWVVIHGEPEFFVLTKEIHNRLHGLDGHEPLEPRRDLYEQTLAANAAELCELVQPQDVVILHDPQTGGMVEAVRAIGAKVIWRCHVGIDAANDHAREAWDFLRPHVVNSDAYVFSRAAFAWTGLDPDRVAVIQPSIDAFSAKNVHQEPEQALAILARAGIVKYQTSAPAVFTRLDGSSGQIVRQAKMLQTEPLRPDDRIVTQVSRWDRLKDPLGILHGFIQHVLPNGDAHLVLAGPDTESVADDPEGAEVLASVQNAWEALPVAARSRVRLASLPMDDLEENAAIVNALQRRSEIVVQKSLAEGFGLTVAEAMWKQRPVVGSRVGGIQEQIVDGQSGVLVSDPRDLDEFGRAVTGLLADPDRAREIGHAAKERVRSHFLGPAHLGHYFELILGLIR
jgi:trehalose synthase